MMTLEEVIPTEESIELPATIQIPDTPLGVVLFAHGSGSSRLSPRNRQVARALNDSKIATILFDLLTPDESEDRDLVFNIPFLAKRLETATRWTQSRPELKSLPIGYFGASTGAGAALWAAADFGTNIAAVVSRGGRPDLAMPRLSKVSAPTLLIVGGDDEPVISMNREAQSELADSKLVIVPGATHLFEEPGTLEAVANHARRFFSERFSEKARRVA